MGDLLVIVPESHEQFRGYVLDLDDDIEEVVAALGVELLGTWCVYDPGAEPDELSEDDCIDKRFREFAGRVEAFPTTAEISGLTLQVILNCIERFSQKTGDAQLMVLVIREYELFQLIERELCRSQIAGRLFKSVDDFLKVAASIMNRRKSRAGRALENHFEHLLRSRSITCDVRPTNVDGKPDVILPSADAYNDSSFPAEKLCMIGLKTTCKDRWRQIISEAPRIRRKHIVTLQQGISAAQLAEMKAAEVTLVVPHSLQRLYPKDTGIEMLTVDAFLRELKQKFGDSLWQTF